MIDKNFQNGILDATDKMLKEIRSLLLFVKTGLKIADKDKDVISHFRLFNSQKFIELAQADLSSALDGLEKYSNKYANNEVASKELKRMIEELLAMSTEHLELAKFNYAYYLEYRNNPDRSIEELMEAASKTEESLLF